MSVLRASSSSRIATVALLVIVCAAVSSGQSHERDPEWTAPAEYESGKVIYPYEKAK